MAKSATKRGTRVRRPARLNLGVSRVHGACLPTTSNFSAILMKAASARRSDFGDLIKVGEGDPNKKGVIIQADGLTLNISESALQYNLDIPEDLRSNGDEAIDYATKRFRRLFGQLGSLNLTEAHWAGLIAQCTIQVPGATSAADAVSKWLVSIGSPLQKKHPDVLMFNWRYGFLTGKFNCHVFVDGYQVQVGATTKSKADLQKAIQEISLKTVETGVGFNVDVNDKPRGGRITARTRTARVATYLKSNYQSWIADMIKILAG